jgi:hypothetical protein
VSTSGRREDIRKGGWRVNMVKYSVHMYVNEKQDMLKLFQKWGKGVKGK